MVSKLVLWRQEMFEFYGWARIASDTYELNDEADDRLLTRLRARLDLLQQHNVVLHLDVGLNGSLNVLCAAGSTNHRYQAVIDLFEWLAEHGSGSYGLL